MGCLLKYTPSGHDAAPLSVGINSRRWMWTAMQPCHHARRNDSMLQSRQLRIGINSCRAAARGYIAA
jgi:hypothetical protein